MNALYGAAPTAGGWPWRPPPLPGVLPAPTFVPEPEPEPPAPASAVVDLALLGLGSDASLAKALRERGERAFSEGDDELARLCRDLWQRLAGGGS